MPQQSTTTHGRRRVRVPDRPDPLVAPAPSASSVRPGRGRVVGTRRRRRRRAQAARARASREADCEGLAAQHESRPVSTCGHRAQYRRALRIDGAVSLGKLGTSRSTRRGRRVVAATWCERCGAIEVEGLWRHPMARVDEDSESGISAVEHRASSPISPIARAPRRSRAGAAPESSPREAGCDDARAPHRGLDRRGSRVPPGRRDRPTAPRREPRRADHPRRSPSPRRRRDPFARRGGRRTPATAPVDRRPGSRRSRPGASGDRSRGGRRPGS